MIATAPRQESQSYRIRPRPAAGGTGIEETNVGNGERLLSVVGGGALAVYGLSRGSLPGLALAAVGGALLYRGATGHCNVYDLLGVSTAQRHSPQASIPATHGVKFEHSLTILKPREELFRFWRDFQNLPRIMSHLESVQVLDSKRSHWVAKGPLGMRFEWDAEIHTEKENELIGWRSLEDSQVDTAGSVHFLPAPGNRGTELKVVLKYDPPGGKLAATAAWLFGQDPGNQIRADLRRFKSIMETGTAPTTEGQPRGRCG